VNLLRCRLAIALSAVVAAAACADVAPPNIAADRDRLLDQGFELMDTDPARAAELFADAGRGTTLESARMSAWAATLLQTQPGTEPLRRYLLADPPDDLGAHVRLSLIRTLSERGESEEALAERGLLPSEFLPQADEILLKCADADVTREAARRLAVSSPWTLEAQDPALAGLARAALTPAEHLDRSRVWRRGGRPERAVVELRRVSWRGDDELLRRRELARAELASGSPLQALRVLPGDGGAGVEDLVLRAQAYRDRAWNLFPDRGEERFFADCAAAADAAIAAGAANDERTTALILRLECATENGELEIALESWRRLEADSWIDERRDWLGRRLGVALARTGGDPAVTLSIARSLPIHERCLRYWSSVTRDSDPALTGLANVGIADLYGVWARQTLGTPSVTNYDAAPPIAAGELPTSVSRLLKLGAESEALRELRRIRQARPPTPDEALAASLLASSLGSPTDSIRWLLAGFPELGTIGMATAPENVIRAYLPLRWEGPIKTAARESGLDPWLIAALARQESGFTAHAVSPRGAVGVLQLLPSTATVHARALGLTTPPDLRDPELNIRLGAHELSVLMRRFGAVEPALAAYNAGEARARRWWRRRPDRHRFTEEIPVPETYNYVRRVVYLSEAYRLVYGESWRSDP
jgi:soluble lytic murein transglycosylase